MISGAGLLLKASHEIKNYRNKIQMSKFAYTTYEKTLADLRFCLRGNEFNHSTFISEMRVIDEQQLLIFFHQCRLYIYT